ncbi:MAG: 23S rRNA (uracil(1939)-C(5))-methyltransferase RlmD [Chlamydiae bacterium]|nr:23S rRNA (uracil(1939)-C(5))-methyltransferase RlmD [Chlamydiota bacterium]
MFKIGSEIELDIRDLSSQGEGVGSFEGITVFVEGALPLEKVKARVTLVKKQYAKAVLIKIIQPSSQRVVPICPVFDQCGGCQIMHLSYEGQLAIKELRIKNAFERIGGFTDISFEKITGSIKQLHYRNKIVLPVALEKGKKVVGLYAKRSHDIVAVSHCYIHSNQGEKILELLRENLPLVKHIAIRTAEHSLESLVLFLTTKKQDLSKVAHDLMQKHSSIVGVVQGIVDEDRNSLFSDTYETVAGRPYLIENFCGYKVKVSAASFFQVNTLQAEALYQKAMELAELNQEDRVLDAYCGIGLLTMMISKHVKKVIGIEIAPSSILDAKENSRVNSTDNIEWHEGATEELIDKVGVYDKVFLNPPRGGCEENILEAVNKMQPKKIVYISCDPATLARDAKYLKNAGWHLESVCPFDMFPQTMHVETVASFSK